MVFPRRPARPFRFAKIFLTFVGLCFLMFVSVTAADEALPALKNDASASADTVKAMLEDVLNSEKSSAAEMEQNLERWQVLKDRVTNEIQKYRLQNTAHNNLLLVSQTRIKDLESALNNNRLAIKSLAERIAEFERIAVLAADRMSQLKDRIDIAEKQIAELGQKSSPQADKIELRKKLIKIRDLLKEKRNRGESFLKTFNALFEQLKQVVADLRQTRGQLEARLQVQVASSLFARSDHLFRQLNPRNLSTELTAFRDQVNSIFKMDFWKRQWVNFQLSGGVTQSVLLMLFLMAVLFRGKIRRFLHAIEQKLEAPGWQARRLVLLLLRRSFVLICAVVLLRLYDLLKLPHVNISLSRFLNQTVLTLLFARWAVDYARHRVDFHDSNLSQFVQERLIRLVQSLRILVVSYLFLLYLFGGESILVWGLRLSLEIVFLAWVTVSWRRFRALVNQSVHPEKAAPPQTRLLLYQSLTFAVSAGAVVLELTGYAALAQHWLICWAKTLMLSLWTVLTWQVIKEWYATLKTESQTALDSATPKAASPLGWFMVQMARLLWLFSIVAGALLVWFGSSFMTTTLKNVFNLSFSVGSLRLSVKGILLTVVVICLTQMATRVGRRLLNEKILDSRNLERGFKDSIVTIISYVIWGIGLLLALGALGVNATSLAVVFGALSIGIGFGLQNIFNNFISGLILLFERPIQVGDYVEINGLWAEVKKINVRATIVQTFDNATVIIPNSDFISQQVTNWSYKDLRMRRHVDVGVAYGSNIELVRDTLLDIAGQTPQILKFPRPDVLFLDHGDSALIFRLRFWAHVDNFFSTSTAVRFELDRRFRELGIEIAFPQRDIHIRSIDPSFFPKTQASEGPVPPTVEKHEAVSDKTNT